MNSDSQAIIIVSNVAPPMWQSSYLARVRVRVRVRVITRFGVRVRARVMVRVGVRVRVRVAWRVQHDGGSRDPVDVPRERHLVSSST